MKRTKRSYFLAPTFEWQPGTGPVALGRIITDPFDAESCINAHCVVPVPKAISIVPHTKSGFQIKDERSRGGLVGLFAQFLSFTGIGGDFSFSKDESKSTAYKLKELRTTSFEPETEPNYLQQCLDIPTVKRRITQSRANLYLIVAVATAVGAEYKRSESKSYQRNLKVGFDATPLGGPVQIGPEFAISKGKKDVMTFDGSDDFVFSYRLREIYYSEKSDSWSTRTYANKGAVYGIDSSSEGTASIEEHLLATEFQLEAGTGDDVGSQDFEDAEFCRLIDDDGEEVECLWRPPETA